MSLRLALLPLCLLAALPALAQTRGLDVRDLVKIDRVSSPILSPDGHMVVFAQRSVDDAGKAATALYARNLLTRDLGPPKRITPDGWNVNSPTFSSDGATVYFLSGKQGTQQVYAMPVAGGEPRLLTNYPLDVDSYKVSPDGSKVAISLSVYADCGADIACTMQRLEQGKQDKASGVVYDRLFVRHWDTWADGRYNQLFWTYATGKAERTTFLVGLNNPGGFVGDVPSKPFGDASEYTWSPDGQSIVFSARLGNRSEPWSTDFDLYLYRVGNGAENLTFDDRVGATRGQPDGTGKNPASDTGPVFSADGKTLFYRAMKRPGFEADRYALMARDVASGQTREIAPDWDRSPSSLQPSADGKSLYVAAQSVGEYPLFGVDIASGEVTELVGDGTVSSFVVAGDTLAFTRNTIDSGDTLYTARANGEAARQITPTSGERLADVKFGGYEQFSFKGAGDATVYGYVVKPWNYEEGKQYPVAFLIHGGPQGSFGNGWSYRWNPQTYAGQGYAVVMIDFHGSTGYGQAFTDAISGDWGGKPLVDLQKGWAAALDKYAFLDGDKACALGASYGGYMVNWIAGNWQQPWKCLVNHNGVFDTRSMGLVTEELWFTEWEFGGTVAANPQAYEKFNPARHIDKWKTPMLVVAGQNDFRVPLDQSLSTFTALQRAGIESKLLYFPDENHWVLKPDNSVLWHDTVNAWLKQHIGQ